MSCPTCGCTECYRPDKDAQTAALKAELARKDEALKKIASGTWNVGAGLKRFMSVHTFARRALEKP